MGDFLFPKINWHRQAAVQIAALQKFDPYNTNQIFGGTIMVYKDKKVEFVKVGENVNRVKLSSIYDNNCS